MIDYKEDVVTVTITFAKSPGSPKPTLDDVVAWVNGMLENRDPVKGYNSLRYSDGRVISASLIDG